MYYRSVTRLNVQGTIAGREARGVAWLDHQWDEQLPGRRAPLDGFGLHPSNGVDLMICRVKDRSGRVVQLAGS